MRRPHGMLERCSDRGCAHEYSTTTIGSDGSRIVTSLLAPAEYLAGMVSTACQAAQSQQEKGRKRERPNQALLSPLLPPWPTFGFRFRLACGSLPASSETPQRRVR